VIFQFGQGFAFSRCCLSLCLLSAALMHGLNNNAVFLRVFEETIPVEHLELFDEYVLLNIAHPKTMNIFLHISIPLSQLASCAHPVFCF